MGNVFGSDNEDTPRGGVMRPTGMECGGPHSKSNIKSFVSSVSNETNTCVVCKKQPSNCRCKSKNSK